MSRKVKRQQINEVIKVIDALGGTNNVARILGLAPPTVSHWKVCGIPRSWLAYLLAKYPEAVAAGKKRV